MPIINMAAIPATIHPAHRTVNAVHKTAEACRVQRPQVRRGSDMLGWQALLAEVYPAISLMLVIGYLLWSLFLGEPTLPWVGEFSPAE